MDKKPLAQGVITFNEPFLTGREPDLLKEVFANKHFSGAGPMGKRVEAYFEKELGAKRALLTTSCTHALEIAALLLDLAPGDEVIVSSFTFVSTPNSFVLRGARPVFADVTRDTLCLTFKGEDIEKTMGVSAEVFNDAEYGKSHAGGFQGAVLEKQLREIGFKKVEVFYHWFVGQGNLINDPALDKKTRFQKAQVIEEMLTRMLPLSRGLFKYLGVYAIK